MKHDSDNCDSPAAVIEDAAPESGAALVAMLFQAGQRESVPSDVVLDVLAEALKNGRCVEEVVTDHDILSRRQRESIQRFVDQQTRNPVGSKSTLGNAAQFATPPNRSGGSTAVVPGELPASDQKFRAEHDKAMPSGADRYEAKEEIGRGGWGVVERAHDHQLERDVAVKKLGLQASSDKDVAKRFLHEARITAQLQHPGIVPVYERGINPSDRQPFYAMKLLDGVTLRDVIRKYHDLPKGEEKRKLFHTLLNQFIDVCQAIAYAHDRNIIHRDLKPSNVVVGEFGETVVVDWGLAKEVGKASSIETEETVRAGTPMPAKAPGAAAGQLDGLLDPVMTQAGSVIGTPAFMSPEQARGANATLDQRTDTYALGGILYVILTGKPPFHGQDVQTTLKQVLDGEYKHPRLIEKAIPAALASICTKAMSLQTETRYQTAGEIADEVLRFLANESVTAHTDSLLERAGRWCRRHPTLATTTIAATIILTTSSTIATAIVSSAHQAERLAKEEAVSAHAAEVKARKEAVAAKEHALVRLEESRSAADSWLVSLSGTLERYPGMTSVRRNLIERAKTHYRDLYESSNGDPDMRLEAARCIIRLGDLELMQGDAGPDSVESAQQAFSGAATMLSAIDATGCPDVVRREKLNAKIGLVLCTIESGSFTFKDSDDLSQTIDDLRALDVAHHNDELRSSVIRGFLALGRGYESIADMENAVTAFESSLEFSQLLDKSTSTSKQHLICTVREDLAAAYAATGQHAKAARTLQDLIDAESERLKAESDRPDLLESRAIARMLWAGEQRYLGDDWAAENAYRGAVEDLSESWQLMFGDHFYSENLAVAQANLGQLAIRLNRLDDAEKMLRAAVDQLTGLMQSAHADRATASRLAACNVSLGHVLLLSGNPAAEETIRRSIDIFEYLEKESTVSTADQLAHAQAIANLGRSHVGRGEFESGIELLAKAASHLKNLSKTTHDRNVAQSLAAVNFDLAKSLYISGETNRSAQLHKNAIEVIVKLSESESADEQLRLDSATVSLLRFLLEAPEEFRNIEQASQILRRLDIGSSVPAHVHQLIAIVRFRESNFPAAIAAMERAHSMRRYPVATDFAIRGCIEAEQGKNEAAEQSLQRAEAGLAASPGDRRMSGWVAELIRLLHP